MPTSKTDKAPKVMDVSHPGKTAPSASAKPIIVTNRPMLKQDPMMATPDGMEQTKPTPEPEISRTARPITILAPPQDDASSEPQQPEALLATPLPPSPASTKNNVAEEVGKSILSADAPKSAENPAADSSTSVDSKLETSETTPMDAAEVPVAAKAPAKSPTETAPASEEAKPGASPTADTAPAAEESDDDVDTEANSGDDQLAPAKAQEEAKRKEEEAKAAILAEQEKIVASKQFYLPIVNAAERRGLNRVLVILVLVIALAVVWADVVLDAGIIHVSGIQPLTHFFK